jgi:hypothetical protein
MSLKDFLKWERRSRYFYNHRIDFNPKLFNIQNKLKRHDGMIAIRVFETYKEELLKDASSGAGMIS